MMFDEPDYTKYSLDELRDARARVDADRCPERTEILDREIQSRLRQKNGAREAEVALTEARRLEFAKQGIGAYLLVAGAVSLVRGLIQADPRVGLSGIITCLFVAIMYGAMILAGVCLLKKWKVGLWIGVAVMLTQLPIFQVGHLSYIVAAVPTLRLGLWPRLGFAFGTGHTLFIKWHPGAQPLYFGLNIIPGVVIGILGYHVDRERENR